MSRNINQWSGKKVGSGGRWEGACGRGGYQGGVLIMLVSLRLPYPTTKGEGAREDSSSLPT